ncbi:hypothetical protein [Streptomyces sp. M3]|uniref:hypothetical protein n=1 Tax=Streptomyces sp. M3 TaxID=295102 RepID=UPI00100E040E|nr:hypothetical protein [Streptomyces sp. M3]
MTTTADLSVSPAVRRSAELEQQLALDPGRFRVLTGDRPTGALHLGHYFGTLHNRVRPEPDALLSAAPLLLGTDATKMSKSRGNSIALGADADETARLIKGATTDADRHITYDPELRPGVSSLVLLAALCLGRDPHEVAEEIGGSGAAGLKRTVTEAVNAAMAPIRARRAEYAQDMGYVRDVLRAGNERANAVAEATLTEVREAMGMFS